jgi:hypothetical protein
VPPYWKTFGHASFEHVFHLLPSSQAALTLFLHEKRTRPALLLSLHRYHELFYLIQEYGLPDCLAAIAIRVAKKLLYSF